MISSKHATALASITLLGVSKSFLHWPPVQPRQQQQQSRPRNIRAFKSCAGESPLLPLGSSQQQSRAHHAASEGGDDREGDGTDYSADPLTGFLGKLLPSGDEKKPLPRAKDLVFNVGEDAKRRGMTSAEMVSAIDSGLKENGWFVTGRVDASLFSESFFFSDPQVSLTGVDKYAEGVAKLFDQDKSRCDVISTEADGEDIVVRWRLSGRLNLPFNPPIKPYVVTTTFERDSEGLLSTQRDEFSIAGWDILLHAVFPGHPFGADPAPPVESAAT